MGYPFNFQQAPTYVLPVDADAKDPTFNEIWLDWLLRLAANVNKAAIYHNNFLGIQGGDGVGGAVDRHLKGTERALLIGAAANDATSLHNHYGTAITVPTLGASPQTFTNTTNYVWWIVVDDPFQAVNKIEYLTGANAYNFGFTDGIFPVQPGDSLRITYTIASGPSFFSTGAANSTAGGAPATVTTPVSIPVATHLALVATWTTVGNALTNISSVTCTSENNLVGMGGAPWGGQSSFFASGLNLTFQSQIGFLDGLTTTAGAKTLTVTMSGAISTIQVAVLPFQNIYTNPAAGFNNTTISASGTGLLTVPLPTFRSSSLGMCYFTEGLTLSIPAPFTDATPQGDVAVGSFVGKTEYSLGNLAVPSSGVTFTTMKANYTPAGNTVNGIASAAEFLSSGGTTAPGIVILQR